jgi:nucleotide-binding universal stress UspA family protein
MLARIGAPDGPILIAFDGSAAARQAVTDTAWLVQRCRALVLTVWEAALAYALVASPLMVPRLSGLRGRLEGSTSGAVVKRAPCPVIVVHGPASDD